MSEIPSKTSSERLIQHLRVENQTLLDQISILRLQCKTYEDETRKAVDKLACLKLLVKRAWSGDDDASVHVANIVGVAAPLFESRSGEKIIAIPKSRALNNWASLSIGLLERFYKQREDVMFLKKREYLLQREAFLDSQLDGYVNESRAGKHSLDLVLAVNKNEMQSDSFIPRQRIGFTFKLLNSKRKKHTPKVNTVPSESSLENLTPEALSIEAIPSKEERFVEKKSPRKQRPMSALPSSNSKRYPQSSFEKASKANCKVEKVVNNMAQISRHKSTRTVAGHETKTKRRPYSAHVKYMEMPPSKSQHSYSSVETMRQLDAVEKELKKTTALLQKKLSINPLHFIK